MHQGHRNHQPPQQQYSTGSSMYPAGGAPSIASSMSRRGLQPPPKFRPYCIIIMFLLIGLAFIGLIMTIIAVWPGYSPSGGNPLKIAGPVLLGIGGFFFICGLIEICINNDKQKRFDARKQALIYAHSMSRSTIASAHQYPQPVTPTADKPSKGILKNASSTSTYNGTAKGSDQGSDSGMVGQSFSTNQSYERDSMGSDVSGPTKLENVRVEMNPNPTAAAHKARSTKKAYQNPAYSSQGADVDGDVSQSPPRRSMQTYPNDGYDMYEGNTSNASNTSFTGAGSLTGQASLTGAGMLSPYGTPSSASHAPQSSRSASKWGQTQTQSRPAAPPSGRSNQAYMGDQGVATVSSTYQQMTTPQRPPTARQQQQYSHTPREQYAAPSTPRTPTASTEV